MKNSTRTKAVVLLVFLVVYNNFVIAQFAEYVGDWGFIGGRTGGWKLTWGPYTGDISLSGSVTDSGWVAVRGEFPTRIPTADPDSALVVEGLIEFIGSGFESIGNFRFGVFYSDSAGTLVRDSTADSNWIWTGTEDHHYGYLFVPTSGDNPPVLWTGIGQTATHGAIVDGLWWNIHDGRNYVLGKSRPMPPGAVASAGIYRFAICIQPLEDETSEISFYLIQLSAPFQYHLYKSSIDTQIPRATDKFNCISFAVRNEEGSSLTSLKLSEVMVQYRYGSLNPPGTFLMPFYLEKWGFIGNRFGGWNFSPQPLIGNAAISVNTTPTGWAAIRGEFNEPIQPRYIEHLDEGNALTISGTLEFFGTGTLAWNQLRFGLFHSDSTGTLTDDPADSTHWTGVENHHSGYIFLPPSNGYITNLSFSGTWGGIIDANWFSTTDNNYYSLGNVVQYPDYAVASAGLYYLGISIQQRENNSREVRFYFIKEDSSYVFADVGTDVRPEIANLSYDCFNIAIDSASLATSLILKDVIVRYGDPIDVPNCVNVDDSPDINLVKEYLLSQNYPNPFNPATTISYRLPITGYLTIKVYDLLGREVAAVLDGVRLAGNYSVTFDASGLASGVYLYQLRAGNFVETKKFILLK